MGENKTWFVRLKIGQDAYSIDVGKRDVAMAVQLFLTQLLARKGIHYSLLKSEKDMKGVNWDGR